jgi:parallel beta-helix repeat protein
VESQPLRCQASLTNEQGPPIDPAPGTGFTGAFNRFIVFRGNKVASNGGLVVRGTSANVLLENNAVSNSAVGIHVNYSTTQGGIVLTGNVEPASIPPNYNPYAKN